MTSSGLPSCLFCRATEERTDAVTVPPMGLPESTCHYRSRLTPEQRILRSSGGSRVLEHMCPIRATSIILLSLADKKPWMTSRTLEDCAMQSDMFLSHY